MDGDAIGLIGIGLVGMALAERLLVAGYAVVGYDVDPPRLLAFTELGGMAGRDATDVARRARRVIVALLNPPITDAVVAAIAPHLQRGDMIIDVGTGDPQRTALLAARLQTLGVHWIDAPLSGSSAQIRRGEAVAMLGGADAAIAACDALWPVLAGHRVHLGPAGCGQRAKLATNLILGLNRAALAEGLAFAEALGLDPAAFVELVRISPAYSRAADAKADKMLTRDYAPESRIRQHRKDLGLILEAGHAVHLELPLAAAHAALLDQAIAAGDGERDNAAIVEVWRRHRARMEG